MSIAGHIIGGPVDPDYHGAVLTADLTIGDTVLHVDDTADFDEDAAERDAQVILGLELDSDGGLDPATGTALLYTTCDDDAGTVTLAAPSTVAASTGDRVYLADPVTGGPVGELVVMVALDDADSTGDALPAKLDAALLTTVGDIDLTDLAVDLDEDEDELLNVTSFPGLSQRSGDVKFMQDDLTVAATGDQTLQLTYRPLKNSEHLYWNGQYQPGSEWTRDGWTVTVPDPGGVVKIGDLLVMEYAYVDPTRGISCRPVSADPGAVTLTGPSGLLPRPASAVVGSSPQWADDNDATYASTHSIASGGGYSGADQTYAPLPTLSALGISDPAQITGAILQLRTSRDVSGGTVNVYLSDSADPSLQTVAASPGVVSPGFPGAGVPIDTSWPFADPAAVAAVLGTATPYLLIQTAGIPSDLTVYEASVLLTVCKPAAEWGS